MCFLIHATATNLRKSLDASTGRGVLPTGNCRVLMGLLLHLFGQEGLQARLLRS